MTAPNPNRPPLPAGKVEADHHRKPALNVVRFLNAMYHDDKHPERWTIIYHREAFWVWTGTHYESIDTKTLRSYVYKFFEEAVFWDGPNAIWADFDVNKGKLDQLMDAMASKVLVDSKVNVPVWLERFSNEPVKEPDFNPHDMIPVRSGLLHAPTRRVWGHSPRFLNHFSSDFDYEPTAPQPTAWMHFLETVWPDDPESIMTLQEIFGYLLTHRNEQHKMFMLYGPIRAGKGTIIRVLTALLGGEKNVTPTSVNELGKDFGLANLENKTLAIMSDLRFRSRDDGTALEHMLKITGDDDVLLNKKFKDSYSVRLSCRFLIASNELIRMTDESGALKSRILLLKFTESFYGREDHSLEGRIMDELTGILNWALEGLTRLDERGKFVQPVSGADDLNVIEEMSSPITVFGRACCEVGGYDLEVVRRDIFCAWQQWCKETNNRAGTDSTFARSLGKLQPKLKRFLRGPKGKQTPMYAGIALSQEGQEYLARYQNGNLLGGWASSVSSENGDSRF